MKWAASSLARLIAALLAAQSLLHAEPSPVAGALNPKFTYTKLFDSRDANGCSFSTAVVGGFSSSTFNDMNPIPRCKSVNDYLAKIDPRAAGAEPPVFGKHNIDTRRFEIYFKKAGVVSKIAEDDPSNDFYLSQNFNLSLNNKVIYEAISQGVHSLYVFNGDNSKAVVDTRAAYSFFKGAYFVNDDGGILFGARLKKSTNPKFIEENGIFVGPDSVKDRIVGTNDQVFDGVVSKIEGMKLSNAGQVIFMVDVIPTNPAANNVGWSIIISAEPR